MFYLKFYFFDYLGFVNFVDNNVKDIRYPNDLINLDTLVACNNHLPFVTWEDDFYINFNNLLVLHLHVNRMVCYFYNTTGHLFVDHNIFDFDITKDDLDKVSLIVGIRLY